MIFLLLSYGAVRYKPRGFCRDLVVSLVTSVRHVHGGAVADLVLGDDLFGVDRSLPLAQRVEAAKKRVAKETAQSALSSAAKGQSKGGGGGGGGNKSKGRGRGQQQF